MREYTAADVLRVAKRVNNPKRNYLLVDPLQGKHIPASPVDGLAMMGALGTRVREAYPDAKLVIGFAETATAVGAEVARTLGPETVYLTTTREPLAGEALSFLEEHSHAADQQLSLKGLDRWLSQTGTVVFVDDEFSTGKTLRNMIRQLEDACPALRGKRLAAASVLNRLSSADLQTLSETGVESLSLVSLPPEDYEARVRSWTVRPAEVPASDRAEPWEILETGVRPGDPRAGVSIGPYAEACLQTAEELWERLRDRLPRNGAVLTLGTEECMYPAFRLGKLLEERLPGARLRCHATTRSPIGIGDLPDYPVRNGFRLRSLYDPGRTTFVYNLEPCEAVILLSDARGNRTDGLRDLASALGRFGAPKLYFAEV